MNRIFSLLSAFLMVPVAFAIEGWAIDRWVPGIFDFVRGPFHPLYEIFLSVMIIIVGLLISTLLIQVLVKILMAVAGEEDERYLAGVRVGLSMIVPVFQSKSGRRSEVSAFLAYAAISLMYLYNVAGSIKLIDGNWMETIVVSQKWTFEALHYLKGRASLPAEELPSESDQPGGKPPNAGTPPDAAPGENSPATLPPRDDGGKQP